MWYRRYTGGTSVNRTGHRDDPEHERFRKSNIRCQWKKSGARTSRLQSIRKEFYQGLRNYPQLVMWKVQLFELNYDHREEKAVADVLKSRWITMGESTRQFEEKFGEYNQSKFLPTAVTNCTAALHMALLALDIKQGDEVIISALTFI